MKRLIMQNNHSAAELKNFEFLVPHLPEFEGELKDLLIEIDKLIERKKTEWETDLQNLERKLKQKVEENEELQRLITTKEIELKEATAKLTEIEYNFPRGTTEEELNSIKNKVDKMRRNYETLQKKYRRQLGTEKEQSSAALHRKEQENASLKRELEELRKATQNQMKSLRTQLEEEQLKREKADKRCRNLQLELNELNSRVERERAESRSLKENYQSRCLVLETELEMAKNLSKHQLTEVNEVKHKCNEQEKELSRLINELDSARTSVSITEDAFGRLERLVMQHLATLFNGDSQEITTDYRTSDSASPLSSSDKSKLVARLTQTEQRIRQADCELREKFKEMRRLENACQIASGTIHRLVEARTHSMQQVASLGIALKKAIHGMHSFLEQVQKLDRVLSEKVSATKNGLSGIRKYVEQLRSTHLMVKRKTAEFLEISTQTSSLCRLEAAVQANGYHSQTKELYSTITQLTEERDRIQSRLDHQFKLTERLQKENLALSDLLTGAEGFNRTRITCESSSKKGRLPATCYKDVEIQVDPWPSDWQPETPCVFTTRKSLPCLITSSRTISRPLHLESQTTSDSQASTVRFQPLSPASFCTNTLDSTMNRQEHFPQETCLEFGDQTLTSPVDSNNQSTELPTRSTAAVNLTPIPTINASPVPHGDSMDSHSSVTSPSEYVNIALTCTEPRTTTSLTAIHDRNSWRTRVPGSPSVAQPVGIRRSRSFHIRLPPPKSAPLPSNRHSIDSDEPLILHNLADSSAVRSAHQANSLERENENRAPESDNALFPQTCSTINKNSVDLASSRPNMDAGNDDTDDTSVYDLAAKFLADEQKYSMRLEQQIDAHLEMLKSQFGMCS